MPSDTPEPDPNVEAARIVGQSAAGQDPLPGDLEAAWAEWSGRIHKVDDRTRTLLRAAFEAGYSAASSS